MKIFKKRYLMTMCNIKTGERFTFAHWIPGFVPAGYYCERTVKIY